MRRPVHIAPPPRPISSLATLQLYVGTAGSIGLYAGGMAATINGWLMATLGYAGPVMPWVMLGLYGVLVGVGFFANLVASHRLRRFYRRSRFAYGRIVRKERIGSQKNRRYRFTFEYRDVEEERLYHPHQLPRRWGKVIVQNVVNITDEPEEPLLFDPDDPEKIEMIDSPSGFIRIGEDGGIEGRSWYVVLMLLLVAVSVGSAVTLLMWLEGTLQPLLGL